MKRYTLLVSLLVLTACGDFNASGSKSAAAPAAPPPAAVDVVTVTAEPVTLTRDLPGRLQALRSVQVRARVEGVVEERLFEEGSDVAKGTPLYHINADYYRVQLQAAKAEIAVARAVQARYKPLQRNKVASQQDLESAQLRVRLAETGLSKARLDLSHAIPTANIAGRIGISRVDEGALVGKGEATHLATIERLDPIRVEFTRSHAAWLTLQQVLKSGRQQTVDEPSAQLLLEDGSLYPHSGRITYTSHTVEPDTGTIVQRAEFPNPQRQLLPGAYVLVRLPVARIESAVRVPQRAVSGSASGRSVIIVTAEGKANSVSVETAGMLAGDFIVSKGLSGGEQVIVNGLQKVRPGAVVQATPWQADAPLLAAPAGAKKK